MIETIADLKEAGLLARYAPLLRRHTAGLELPTGDDVAITLETAGRMVWTIDTMVEGTHFRWYDHPLCTPAAIAAKLVASNASDLASKGAIPRWALLSLGVPSHARIAALDDFFAGLDRALLEHGLRLIGGDTVGSPQWTMTLTVTGELPPGLTIAARHAAVPGMGLWLVGWPGESAAGFHLLNDRTMDQTPAAHHDVIQSHLSPMVDVAVGRRIVEQLAPVAMIDTSDGPAKDAGEIARASGVAILIEELPLSPALQLAASRLGRDPLDLAFYGGEDYGLLFCTSAADSEVVRAVGSALPLHRIGRVVEGAGVWFARPDGTRAPLATSGFDHFRG
jgi:thiamine-monophosphate kinase